MGEDFDLFVVFVILLISTSKVPSLNCEDITINVMKCTRSVYSLQDSP